MAKKEKSEVFSFIRSRKYFTLLVVLMTTVAVFSIVYSVSTPKHYSLKIGERSKWDIDAPFEMEDRILSERYAEEAARAVARVYVRDSERSDAIISGA